MLALSAHPLRPRLFESRIEVSTFRLGSSLPASGPSWSETGGRECHAVRGSGPGCWEAPDTRVSLRQVVWGLACEAKKPCLSGPVQYLVGEGRSQLPTWSDPLSPSLWISCLQELCRDAAHALSHTEPAVLVTSYFLLVAQSCPMLLRLHGL